MNIATRGIILLATIATFVCQTGFAADDAAKPRQLIERAIKAMGGNAALEKSRRTIFEEDGTYYGMGQGLPYKGRYVFEYGNAGRYRMEIIDVFVTVLDGDKGWMEAVGNVSDIEGESLKLAKQAYFIGYVASLLPLQKSDPAFTLSSAKPEKIDGEECDGINIDHAQMPTLTIHFSRKTGLMKKTKYTAKVEELGFKEALEETVFHTYKEIDGLQRVTHFTSTRDGKKFVEAKPRNVTFPATIDEKEFKKPE